MVGTCQQATVKLSVNGKAEHHVAEGDGPVKRWTGYADVAARALSADRERASERLQGARLIPGDETAASVRVVIESRRKRPKGAANLRHHRRQRQRDRGSWAALVDAYEYHLCRVAEESGV